MTALPEPPAPGTYLRGRDGSIWTRYTKLERYYKVNLAAHMSKGWVDLLREYGPVTVLVPSEVIGGER